MKTYYVWALFVSLFLSLPAYAHSGHDHTSIVASLIHFFWLAPALIGLIYLLHKFLKKNYQI